MIPVPGSSVHVAIIWGRYICTINLLVICTSMCIYIYICILYIYIYISVSILVFFAVNVTVRLEVDECLDKGRVNFGFRLHFKGATKILNTGLGRFRTLFLVTFSLRICASLGATSTTRSVKRNFNKPSP